jgi:subtilisin
MWKKSIVTLFLLITNILLTTSVFGVEKKVIIGFNKEPGNTEMTMIESKQGRITEAYRHIRAVAVEIDESELAGIQASPDVAYVEEDMPANAVDPVNSSLDLIGGVEYDNAWSVSLIGTEIAHSKSVTGAGVNVAILDTGVDYNHPDLDQNYSGGDNFISLDPNNHDPMDDSFNSHGTHVAGIVAAELDGVGVVGVSPNASIYAVKVLDGAGFGSVSAIVSGLDWAISHQMDIVNMSMGLSTYSQALDDACAAAQAAGILLVAAAGNSYGGPVLYPAALTSVMAVGATTIFGEISPLSPVGPELEIVAPGLNVYSTVAGSGYGYLGGTSQAAPHVTGLAALLLSAGMVEDIDGNGVINNHDTRLMIQESAIDLGVAGLDEIYGYGLVDVAGPFSGSGGNPITHLTAEILHNSARENAETISIEDGIYDVTIVNDSLKTLKVLVYEGNKYRRDLSKKLKFKKYKGDKSPPTPQETSYALDATGTTYKIVFAPNGEKHSFADIYIQKQ